MSKQGSTYIQGELCTKDAHRALVIRLLAELATKTSVSCLDAKDWLLAKPGYKDVADWFDSGPSTWGANEYTAVGVKVYPAVPWLKSLFSRVLIGLNPWIVTLIVVAAGGVAVRSATVTPRFCSKLAVTNKVRASKLLKLAEPF